MKKYLEPTLEIEVFYTEDIISSSGEVDPSLEKDPYVSDKW